MYPPRLITKPLIWQLGHKFKIVTNIRQASVTDEIGIVCLELDGARSEVKAAIKWMEKHGVNVEPVEISAIAGRKRQSQLEQNRRGFLAAPVCDNGTASCRR